MYLVDTDVISAIDRARGKGQNPGFADAAIAATARLHRLVLLTRNVRHFAHLEVPLLNPLEQLPALASDRRST